MNLILKKDEIIIFLFTFKKISCVYSDMEESSIFTVHCQLQGRSYALYRNHHGRQLNGDL